MSSSPAGAPRSPAPGALDRLEILEVRLPQREIFRSAVGERRERRALLVRVWADEAWGIGESSARPDPFFNGEHLEGAVSMLVHHVVPHLSFPASGAEIEAALGRVRGWPFTAAAVLGALDDLTRRQGGDDRLDRHPTARRERVPVGISLGLFSAAEAAVERVGAALDEGYRRIKMKVSPAADPEIFSAVRQAFPDAPLAFDANGSFGAADVDRVAAFSNLAPACFEQPFAPDRLDLAAELRRRAPDLRVCLDESVASLGQLRTAHALGALDELNLKPGRVGGLEASLGCLDYAREAGLPVWVGGMFETGIGRAHNLRVASRCPDALAHDLSPSNRYFSRDLVADPVTMVRGQVSVPEAPVAIDDQALAELTVRRWDLRPGQRP